MKTYQKAGFPFSSDAKKAGWFSRRHQTDDALREARRKRRAKQQKRSDRILGWSRPSIW